MSWQFCVNYKTDDVMIAYPYPTLRLVPVPDCVGVERDELRDILSIGHINWLRNPNCLVDYVLKAVSLAPNELVSLDQIKADLKANIDPEELDRLTTQVMEA